MEWHTVRLNKGERGKRKRLPERFWAVFVGLFLALALVSGAGWYTWAKMDVEVLSDGEALKVRVFGGTVAELLEREAIAVGPWDAVSPSLDSPLHDGMQISILRAVPVTIRADGQEWEHWTTSASVAQVLADVGLEVNPDDLLEPDRGAAVAAGMEIVVVRVTAETEEREISVPYLVERRPAYDMLKGQTRVLTRGEPGVTRETWRVTYHDGEEFERELVRSEVISKPRTQVLLVGSVDTVSRGGQDLRFSRTFTAEATAYTYTGNNTATGVAPGPGTVAVDPRVIPLGSRLYIDGYGLGRAMDVGSAIKGERVDVFFTTRQEALRWGRRTVNVYVLD